MKNDNPYYNSKIQKIINKLISEEWLAGNMYMFYKQAVDHETSTMIEDLFSQIGVDELDEHYVDLVEWAKRYGFDVPCSVADFERYAGKVAVKLFKSFKKGEKAEYYINKVIEAEQDAINSYYEALNEPELLVYGDLQAILLRNLTDEQDHLEKLGVLSYADKISLIQIS